MKKEGTQPRPADLGADGTAAKRPARLVDKSGAKVYTITDTDTDTGETLLTNATIEIVKAWASPDPLQVVLTRIASITEALTATTVDVEDLRGQLDQLTTDVLDLIAEKLGNRG